MHYVLDVAGKDGIFDNIEDHFNVLGIGCGSEVAIEFL